MDFFWQFVKLIIVLPLVLITAVYVIKFGLTRLYPDHYIQRGGLKIIERLHLTQKSWICLVQAGEKYLLLGVTSGGINSLGELSPEDVAAILPKEEKKDFQKYLNEYQRDSAAKKAGLVNLKQKLSGVLRNTADKLDDTVN
ncbi:FliO/MopB family protein [Candidatus Contubernalis alkaliaceticus]|uniref:FliO/MopB family protein n=1 Tax=Candidatus Contubernalis alkaliaceticus TaxID=338645 RepID=UPI001F4BFBE2|nr:flagellar biosynthetic protein FliO [Candidatus Contubernalis alkalaceticus]UNC91756.1 flagellar biosynthetic protein FliO [Candidatus Contubernalis alkalaceticus]